MQRWVRLVAAIHVYKKLRLTVASFPPLALALVELQLAQDEVLHEGGSLACRVKKPGKGINARKRSLPHGILAGSGPLFYRPPLQPCLPALPPHAARSALAGHGLHRDRLTDILPRRPDLPGQVEYPRL